MKTWVETMVETSRYIIGTRLETIAVAAALSQMQIFLAFELP